MLNGILLDCVFVKINNGGKGGSFWWMGDPFENLAWSPRLARSGPDYQYERHKFNQREKNGMKLPDSGASYL